MRRTVFADLRQTGEWVRYLSSIGWIIEQVQSQKFPPKADQSLAEKVQNYLYIRKIPLTPFAIAKLQRPIGTVDWYALEMACRAHRVIRLYVEPMTALHERQLLKRGFSKTKTSYLPRKTIWLDLAKTERQLLTAMKPKTRYNIGLAKRRGVKIEVIDGDTLERLVLKGSALRETFYTLLQQNAWRLGIFALPRKWYEVQIEAFGKKCFATLAYPSTSRSTVSSDRIGSGQASKLIAGNFFMTSENACFYSHNGSTDVGRKLMAPSLCVWEGIREAKRRRLKIFDFDGIDDGTKELKRWQGFSQFKRGFSDKEVLLPQQWGLWRWPG